MILFEIQKKTFEGIKVHEQYLNAFENFRR